MVAWLGSVGWLGYWLAGLAGLAAWVAGWLAGLLAGWLGWLLGCPSEVSDGGRSEEVGGSAQRNQTASGINFLNVPRNMSS